MRGQIQLQQTGMIVRKAKPTLLESTLLIGNRLFAQDRRALCDEAVNKGHGWRSKLSLLVDSSLRHKESQDSNVVDDQNETRMWR